MSQPDFDHPITRKPRRVVPVQAGHDWAARALKASAHPRGKAASPDAQGGGEWRRPPAVGRARGMGKPSA
jgi:hypothetical protein